LSNEDQKEVLLVTAVLYINSRKILIISVRDPFTRLVSAFRDKMVPDEKTKEIKSYLAPVSMMINQQYRHKRADESTRARSGPLDIYATFEDFVNFLIYSNPRGNLRNDANWRTYSAACTPCENRYDVIIKLETIEEDLQYLKWELAMEKQDWEFIRKQHQEAAKTTDLEVQEMFKSVPVALIQELYQRMRKDFDMFGYPRPHWLPQRPQNPT